MPPNPLFAPFPGTLIDMEIRPLVDAIREHPLMGTLSSCCGHGKKHATVSIGVYGLVGLSELHRILNKLDADATRSFDAMWGATVVHSIEVATQLDPESGWISLDLVTWGIPTDDELIQAATDWRRAARLWCGSPRESVAGAVQLTVGEMIQKLEHLPKDAALDFGIDLSTREEDSDHRAYGHNVLDVIEHKGDGPNSPPTSALVFIIDGDHYPHGGKADPGVLRALLAEGLELRGKKNKTVQDWFERATLHLAETSDE